MRNLMFGDYVLVAAGIAYNLVFATVVILIVVRIFATGKLPMGRMASTDRTSKGMRALGR